MYIFLIYFLKMKNELLFIWNCKIGVFVNRCLQKEVMWKYFKLPFILVTI